MLTTAQLSTAVEVIAHLLLQLPLSVAQRLLQEKTTPTNTLEEVRLPIPAVTPLASKTLVEASRGEELDWLLLEPTATTLPAHLWASRLETGLWLSFIALLVIGLVLLITNVI